MSLSPPTLLLATGAAIALLIAVGLLKRAKKHAAAARDIHAARGDLPLARDIQYVMQELDQLARQTHARLDAQFTKLEAISRAADERIDRLSRLVRAADGAATIDLMVSDEAPSGGHPLGPTPPSHTHGPAPSSTNAPPGRHAEIHNLAEAGLSPQQICEKTGQTVGEVELILSLRRMQRSAAVQTA